MSRYAIVMAGGTGTRLWPYSRRSRPKQLLPLLGDRSLLQATVDRLSPAIGPDRVIVVTNREYVREVVEQLPDVPPAQIVGEPMALGTAACVGLGTALIRARDPEATVFVLPADHVIRPVSTFHDDLARAEAVAQSGHLVTFGIHPTAPETGFGYIELDDPLGGDARAYRVVRFVEKPDRSTAQSYLEGGRYLWNSGMFAWTAETIDSALRKLLPNLHAQVDRIAAWAASGDLTDERLAEAYSGIADRTTIDYGVMERSANVACVPATFQWSDVGSWDALADVLHPGDGGNIVRGRSIDHDSRDCVIYGVGKRLIATVGLRDLVIVDTDDALLVCARDRAQDVREIVAQLEDGDDALL